MNRHFLSKYINRAVSLALSDGSVYHGVGWQILFGEDKADDAPDYGVDSLLIKINEDNWTEYIPGSGATIELADSL